MLKIHLYHIVLFVAFITAGCSIPAKISDDKRMKLPDSFSNHADSLNAALINKSLIWRSEKLNSLIDTVIRHNYDLKIAYQKINVFQSEVQRSNASLLPTVNGLVSPSLRKFGRYTMDGAGNIVTDMETGKLVPIELPDYNIGLFTSWEIDVWGKLKNRKKAAIARLLSSTEGRKLIQTTLVATTAEAYFSLLALDKELMMLDQTISLQEKALEAVYIQKEAAKVNELAVKQFEAQLIGYKGLREEVLLQINRLETGINQLAGRLPQVIERDTSYFDDALLPLIQVGLPTDLLKNRPDIRQAELEVIASRADLLSARAAFFPAINLTGSLATQAYRPALLTAFPESLAFSIVGGLSRPLWNQGFLKAEFLKATAAQKEALLHFEKTIINAYHEVNQGLYTIHANKKIYDSKVQEQAIQTESIDISYELFKTGRASYLEVLLAQQNAVRSTVEVINAKRNQFIAAINVYRAIGGGWN